MGYLILKDYQRIIQTNELNAIKSNDDSIRLLVEGSVQTEINSKLIQRFDTFSEFTDTSVFNPLTTYKGNQRIYLDAPAYNPATSYLLINKTQVLQGGLVYIITANTTGAFDATKWALLGAQYDLFYIKLPCPLFSVDTIYLKNDQSFWRDKVYTAQKDTASIDQQEQLQAPSIESIAMGNVLPDDRKNGSLFWGIGASYSVTAGTLPTDTTKWAKGDNRNQQFVSIYMDIVVYELCKRIAPNNVPEVRHNAWVKAYKTIEAFAAGNDNAQIAIVQPKQGNRISFGGYPRKEFDY